MENLGLASKKQVSHFLKGRPRVYVMSNTRICLRRWLHCFSARRAPCRRSARAKPCPGRYLIPRPLRQERGIGQGARAAAPQSSELPGGRDSAARATRVRAAASQHSLPLLPSRRPYQLKLPGDPGREEGRLRERQGIPPSTENSRLFTIFTSAAGGNPRLSCS